MREAVRKGKRWRLSCVEMMGMKMEELVREGMRIETRIHDQGVNYSRSEPPVSDVGREGEYQGIFCHAL